MKAVQIMMDENLLAAIDRDPEAREQGRSAFLRHAAAWYLKQRRTSAIRDAYRRGYKKAPQTTDELGPWLGGQAWPEP